MRRRPPSATVAKKDIVVIPACVRDGIETLDIATQSFYLGDDSESADTVTAQLAVEEIAIKEECIEAELKDTEEEEEVRSASADTEEHALGPCTAAQNSELHKMFNASMMLTLDPLIDLIFGKVQTSITTEMQASFKPVCCDPRSQIKVVQNEFFFKRFPVQIRMKRYCFKRSDNGKFSKPT